MADLDLSVFRKQRKLEEKRAKRRKLDIVAPAPVENKVKDEKIIGEIRTLENRIIEDVALKHDLEKEMRETRMIMYVVLAVTLAIFAFLVGVLVRYIGR